MIKASAMKELIISSSTTITLNLPVMEDFCRLVDELVETFNFAILLSHNWSRNLQIVYTCCIIKKSYWCEDAWRNNGADASTFQDVKPTYDFELNKKLYDMKAYFKWKFEQTTILEVQHGSFKCDLQ